MDMKPRELPEEGIQELMGYWESAQVGAYGRKSNRPPVVLTREGPLVAEYFDAIRRHPRSTVIWAWPGQWRTDVFAIKAGELIAYAKRVEESWT